MSSNELPVGDPEKFLGECEQMDLSALKDKLFMVAINSGGRDAGKFICETIHGPYTFPEAVEEAALMWHDYQHHAKIYVISKNKNEPVQWLDECTIDYFEAKHADIITESFMEGLIDSPEYTCRAGLINATDEDPRLQPKKDSQQPVGDDDE